MTLGMEITSAEAAVAQPVSGHVERATGPVVVVIPAFNEERFIASVVIAARGQADEVVVVDDGSIDRTADIAQLAGARVVRLGVNQGKAAALNAGFRAAHERGPAAVVCIDGDAQHDPADIPAVVEPILFGKADVVIGSRFLGRRSRIPAWRQIGQHALTLVTNVTSGMRITDSQSGFRAFSPRALERLRFKSTNLSVESEMQFLVRDAQLTVAEAPIRVQYLDGNKRNPIVHGMQVLDAVLSLVARRRPLLFFTVPGIALQGLGLVLGARVYVLLQLDHELRVGSAIASTTIMTVGIVLAISGVMLHSIQHLVNRIREEIRGHDGFIGRDGRSGPQVG